MRTKGSSITIVSGNFLNRNGEPCRYEVREGGRVIRTARTKQEAEHVADRIRKIRAEKKKAPRSKNWSFL